jgi:hypothetical protein
MNQDIMGILNNGKGKMLHITTDTETHLVTYTGVWSITQSSKGQACLVIGDEGGGDITLTISSILSIVQDS